MIFMAGIHGAGKTTIGKRLEERWNIACVTASALIEAASSQIMPDNKVISSIGENQEILIHEVQKLRDSGITFVLEGHFCLINRECEIERISRDVFKRLNPERIIIIIDQPERIAQRNERKGQLLSNIAFIERFQETEVKYGKEVGRYLGIPCRIVENQEEMLLKLLEGKDGGDFNIN